MVTFRAARASSLTLIRELHRICKIDKSLSESLLITFWFDTSLFLFSGSFPGVGDEEDPGVGPDGCCVC